MIFIPYLFIAIYCLFIRLNKYIIKKKFKMQGTRDVRAALQPKMFGAVIDISDAYYHIGVHKKARKYTRFIVDGVIYEYLGREINIFIIDN